MNNIEETAVQDEQRLQEFIMDEIIEIFAGNGVTVNAAEKILFLTKEKIKQQKVTSS